MSSICAIPLLALSLSGIETAGVAADASAEPSPSGRYKAVAVMPLSSLGSTDEAVGAIQSVLLGEFTKILKERMVSPDALLDQGDTARGAFYACAGVVTCLVEVIGGLGWDAFVVGNVAGLGDRQVINLKLIDVRTGREVRKTSEKATGSEAQLVANMRKAAVELVAPHLFTGTLELLAKQTGVQILIDGKLVGTTPLTSPRIEVAAGRHAIEAKGEGWVPFTTMSDVQYGEVQKVTIDLAKSSVFVGGDTPFRHQWWTWAIAGAGIIGLSVGGYFNVLHADAVDRIEKRADPARGGCDVGCVDLNDEQKAHWNRAVIFYGVGGALTAGAGVLLALDFM
jgi:hypothetical protein